MSGIFETHAHYEDSAFDADRDELLKSLSRNNIEYVVNVGASEESCRQTLELADRYDFVYGALGIHPDETETADGKILGFIKEECLNNPKIVAVGEIGLDYYHNRDNAGIQTEWFEQQLEIAKETGKPVIIHSREAARDTYDILLARGASACGGVIHCFSYSAEEAAKYLDMGFYIGVGGVVTFKNARKLKETVRYVPLENILLETDCPYMAPEPYRGSRNSSLYIPEIAAAIAEIKGVSADEVVEVTNANAKRMYKICI